MSLDPLILAKLLEIAPANIKQEVIAKIDDCFSIIESKTDWFRDERYLIHRPTVTFDLKGTTAGTAQVPRSPKLPNIQLNLDMLLDPALHNDMLHSTLPHEVAHIVQYQIWPSSPSSRVKPHGREWAYVMSLLGLPAKRCHQYDTTNHKQRTHKRPHHYTCPCGRKFHLTNNLDNKIQMGQRRICPKCRGELIYEYSDAAS